MAAIKSLEFGDEILATFSISEKEYDLLKRSGENLVILPARPNLLDEVLTTGRLGNGNRIMLPMKILRAHRLWESYLQSVGAPGGEIHQMAHQLEHLEYDQSVGYLDSKLGHPLHGPHGEYIPEESDKIEAIKAIPLKDLKNGEEAEVISVGEKAGKSGLKKGDIILSKTSMIGKITISRKKTKKTLSKDAAMQVIVRLVERGKKKKRS